MCTDSSLPPVMSARESFSSFYSTQLRRFLRICRRVSRSSTSNPSSEEYLDCPVGQQFAEGTAFSEGLPALPTSAQIAQGGGSVLYRQRDQDETEPVYLPAGCPYQQDVSVQVRLSPSCDMLLRAALSPKLPEELLTLAEENSIVYTGKADQPEQRASRNCGLS